MAKRMSSDLRAYSTRIVGMLIIVMAVTVYFLWALNPIDKNAEAVFAILLAIDMVAFMMTSYIYRTYKSGEQFSRALLIGSCAMILVLVYASLAV
jgi:predicted membrane channel-forming protein YqfA (hemolysin III family)